MPIYMQYSTINGGTGGFVSQENVHDFTFQFGLQKLAFSSLERVSINWGDGSARMATGRRMWQPVKFLNTILGELTLYMAHMGEVQLQGPGLNDGEMLTLSGSELTGSGALSGNSAISGNNTVNGDGRTAFSGGVRNLNLGGITGNL